MQLGLRAGVLDTNVFADVHSCRDYIKELSEISGGSVLSAEAANHPKLVYRRARAREALLLANYLHDVKGTTFSLQNEALHKLEEFAPPSEPPGTSFITDFTSFFIWFVQPEVLSDWKGTFCRPAKGVYWPSILTDLVTTQQLPMPEDPEVLAPTGNNADRWHIATAKEMGIDLITFEGFGVGGYGSSQIAKWAAREGVRARLPSQVFAGIDERFAALSFMRRFREAAPRYVALRRDEIGPDLGYQVIGMIYDYYEHILFGSFPGSFRSLRVRIG